MSVIGDPELQALIDGLQARSEGEAPEMIRYFSARAEAGDLDWNRLDTDANRYLADKMVALEPAKAALCYLTCRALRATRVVEVGTSFGVSTLYLAAAVRDNTVASGMPGVVIATEYEPAKAASARANFAAAKLSRFIDLREGDLRETLKVIEGPVDFVLMDVWTEMVRPAIELIAPHLRPGAVVICDNTEQFAAGYEDYFAFVREPANRLRTITLPYTGGLEFTVRV
jgi:predicted O-methyltransferase YrrM